MLRTRPTATHTSTGPRNFMPWPPVRISRTSILFRKGRPLDPAIVAMIEFALATTGKFTKLRNCESRCAAVPCRLWCVLRTVPEVHYGTEPDGRLVPLVRVHREYSYTAQPGTVHQIVHLTRTVTVLPRGSCSQQPALDASRSWHHYRRSKKSSSVDARNGGGRRNQCRRWSHPW